MMMLTADERREYDKLLSFYEMSGDSRELAAKARQIVAERRAQKKIQTLRELAVSSLGVKEKISVFILYRWFKENGMEFLGSMLSNAFAQKGWQTTTLGAAMLVMAGFVTFYCSTDATGGWIDPHCAHYTKIALWFTGVGHILAPGFTATMQKK